MWEAICRVLSLYTHSSEKVCLRFAVYSLSLILAIHSRQIYELIKLIRIALHHCINAIMFKTVQAHLLTLSAMCCTLPLYFYWFKWGQHHILVNLTSTDLQYRCIAIFVHLRFWKPVPNIDSVILGNLSCIYLIKKLLCYIQESSYCHWFFFCYHFNGFCYWE